jgi:hypothetical protein
MINGWHTELNITDYYGDSVVGVQTRLRDERSGVQIPVEAKYSTRLQNVETGSGGHPASCTMGSFPGVKRPGREVYQSSSSRAEVTNEWSYTSTSGVRPHGVGKDKSTITLLPFMTLYLRQVTLLLL